MLSATQEAIALDGKLGELARQRFISGSSSIQSFERQSRKRKITIDATARKKSRSRLAKVCLIICSTERLKFGQRLKPSQMLVGKLSLSSKYLRRYAEVRLNGRSLQVLGQPINELESIKALVELGWLEEQLVERLGAAMDKFTESAFVSISRGFGQ